ncbi:glycosyltransferase [Robiginitalea sp. IMCC43444]|uniref:glycosyltransferase n=1 Tax=Robiginitalea sp. IMCC43444 TaxID=3459121 RepID=UPI004041D290
MKKKLLIVIDSLKCGGAEKSLVTLLNNLDYSKYEVEVLVFFKGGEFESFLPSKITLTYYDISLEKNPFVFFLCRVEYWIRRQLDYKHKYHISQLYWKAVRRIVPLNQKKYHSAIAYGQGFSTYYVSEKVVNYKNKYAWLNTNHIKAGYDINFDYLFYKNFNKVIAVSEESKSSLENNLSSIDKILEINIIRDIVDKETIKKMSEEFTPIFPNHRLSRKFTILTVCRLEKVKGLDIAIEASELLKDKGLDFIWYVVGEGSQRNELELQIKKKNLSQHFILLGHKNNPYPFMKECDVYVQPSYYEGLGITVIEASVLKKPIVTTDFPTAHTIIKHNETGLICDMNAISLKEGILKFLKDQEFKNKICHNLNKLNSDYKTDSLDMINNLIG